MGFSSKKDDRQTKELNAQYQEQIDRTNAELEQKRAAISREKLAILKSHTESWAPEVFRPEMPSKPTKPKLPFPKH